jgi:LytS/YehU family sensor histidine kinase
VYHYFRIDISWYYAVLTIFLITLFTWEGNRLVEKLVRRLTPPFKNKVRYLIIFFTSGSFIAFISALAAVYLVGHTLLSYNWQQIRKPLELNVIYASLINLLFHLLNAILFFFQEYKRHWKEVEELRRTHSQAQVQLVKSQINPHFLFNNLNVLSGMVIKDNPAANEFIEEFAKVYRYVLYNQEKELVELNSELEFIQPYLFLLNKRFEEGLVVDITIPNHYKSSYIIPVALQMLIENAIKHNVVSRHKPLHIDIHANGNHTLVIKNNLQRRKVTEPSSKIGLENIRKRYELISGRGVIVKETADEFEVVLPLLQTTG